MVTACGVAGKAIGWTAELQAGPGGRESPGAVAVGGFPARAGRCAAHLSLSVGLVMSCLLVEAEQFQMFFEELGRTWPSPTLLFTFQPV